MLNCILYVMLTYARQTANIYFDESSAEGLDLLKSLCESNQFYCITVYAQLHSLRYVNIGPPNGEQLICRIFYAVGAEGFLAVDAGAAMAAWVVATFVAGPGKLVWHA